MSKLREFRIINYSEEVSDAVVFEVVGKFTSGCETSESERDGSSEDFDDEEAEEDVEDFEDDTAEADGPSTGAPSTQPIQPGQPGQPGQPQPNGMHNIVPKWIPMWRRQSIV